MSSKILCFLFVLILANQGFAQNGKLITKNSIDLSKTPIWTKISENDNLTTEYKYLDALDFYFITYWSDSLQVKGILIEPNEAGKYPVVIFNRGGNRNFAELTLETMIRYTSKLAEQGYVIIGSNYREKDEFGGAELNDVLCLTETVKAFEKADTNRIGMYGWSRGGMMTYLALQKSTKIKTAIVGNGPTDLFGIISERPEIETKVLAECVPNYYVNKEDELKRRSVIYWAEELNKSSSLLIVCGTADTHVNPKQAEQLATKLTDLNYTYELRKFDTDHFFSDKKHELNKVVIDWFEKELKEGK